jgi:hypothetical protein
LRFAKPFRWAATVVLGASASIVGLAQPASADPRIIYGGPVWNLLTVQRGVGKAMAVLNASTGNTAPMVQHWYTGAAPRNDYMLLEMETTANVWRIKPDHTYTNDFNPHNDKCLAVKNNEGGNNIPIVNANCSYDTLNNDVWHMDPVADSTYQFRNQATGKCITTQNASTGINARLITYTCNSGHHALWTISS